MDKIFEGLAKNGDVINIKNIESYDSINIIFGDTGSVKGKFVSQNITKDAIESGKIIHLLYSDSMFIDVSFANGKMTIHDNDFENRKLRVVSVYGAKYGEDTDIQKEVDKLKAEFDSVLTGVTQDSEILDARVKADGSTAPTLGEAIRGQVMTLKEDLTQLDEIIGDALYQYVNESGKVDGKLWNNTSSAERQVANDGYFLYPKFHLKAGTYVFVDSCFVGQSYVGINGAYTKMQTYCNLPKVEHTGEFTLSDDCDVYISGTKARTSRVRIVNLTDIPFDTESEEYGLIEVVLSNRTKVTNNNLELSDGGIPESKIAFSANDFTFYDQAYLKNRELTCNNDHRNSSGTIAKYMRVDMLSTVKKIMAKAKFKGSGQVAIITTKLNTKRNIQDITDGSVHLVFSSTSVNVGIYAGTWERVNIPYAQCDNTGSTEYEMGFEFLGNDTIRVYLPDGTTQERTIQGLDEYNGRYAIWEHYTYRADESEVITDDWNHVLFTGFYCSCESHKPLKDNFQRENGMLTVAPSGHVYTCFRNVGVDDSIYDCTN